MAPIKAAQQAQTDYYQALKNKYSDYPTLNDQDYHFLDMAHIIINNPGFEGDAELERDKIFAAATYANNLKMPFDVAYLNLDVFHEQWTGQKFVKKTGVKAVIDSFGVSLLSQQYNQLAIEYHNSGQDPDVLKRLQEVNSRIEKLRDNVPKIWQDEYIKQGGWADIGAFFRSITTSAAENAVPMAAIAGAGVLAGTGIGALVEAFALPTAIAGWLVAGASGLALAETSAYSTVGTEYLDLISQGIPDDIAWTNANLSAQVQGAIEAFGGGVVGTTTKRILGSIAPSIVQKAVNRWFMNGKMGAGSKAILEYFTEMAAEGLEEGAQQLTSIGFYNLAAEQTNARNAAKRDELLHQLYDGILEESRRDIEKELEKYPEIDRKEFEAAWKEISEATIGGMGTALLLGIPGARIGYRNNVQSAATLASLAENALNKEVFMESEEASKAAEPFTEGMKTDEKKAFLSDHYDVIQQRMSPEQRAENQRQAQDAESMAKVTDYSSTGIEDYEDEETKEIRQRIVTPNVSNIPRNRNGTLQTDKYEDTNEDGSTDLRYVFGNSNVNGEEQNNRFGSIHATINDNEISINQFQMSDGYENLRGEFFNQFANDYKGYNITWNTEDDLEIAKRNELVNNNQRGPKYGLNYYEKGTDPQVSNEARQVENHIRQFMPENTPPMQVTVAGELFRPFFMKKGESLNGAINRIEFTNDASKIPQNKSAQRVSEKIKGAYWIDQTLESARKYIYLNKNASDPSTVIHEMGHDIAKNYFTQAELNIAARALDGYTISKGKYAGTTVNFQENVPWTDVQHEAFTDALENYLANGNAPSEEAKGIFEKIKEFMKRIYEKMKGWTELSPRVEDFYKSLFSGELVDQAKAEEAQQQEASKETSSEKPNNSAEEPLYQTEDEKRDEIISDPDIPIEAKAPLVYDAAGEAYTDALYQIIGEELEEEEHSKSNRISEWLSPENLSTAKGMSREEIFAHFGNEHEPIASIPTDYLKYLTVENSEPITDPTVYSGKGYFIDHAVHNHPEIDRSEYLKIPDVLAIPDDVKLDDRNPDRNSLVFIKKYDKYATAVVSVDTTDTGKIVIHKSFFNPKKNPYPQLRSIRASSPNAATSSISHAGNPTPGGRLSTLDDTKNIPQENVNVKSSDTFYQTEDVDTMEEAVGFEDGAAYRKHVEETYDELPREIKSGLESVEEKNIFESQAVIEAATAAWYDEFVKKSKEAVAAREKAEQAPSRENATPKEIDAEFNEMIPDEVDEFYKVAKSYYNNPPAQEEDEEIRDIILEKLNNPLWTTSFKAERIPAENRQKLISMMRANPRTYRDIYAKVMKDDYWAVSAEDSMAEPLKYRITDSKRQDVDGLNPEQQRQLARDIAREDFARKVQTGKAKFNDEGEKDYIKWLQDNEKAAEEELKELNADRQEDNEYINNNVSAKFKDVFERALKAKENLTRTYEKIEKIEKAGERVTERMAMQKKQAIANYNTIIQNLESLEDIHKFELDIQKILADETLKDYKKSVRSENRMEVALVREAARRQWQAYYADMKTAQENRKQLTLSKVSVIKRTFRRLTNDVNAEQALGIMAIQWYANPKSWKEIETFIGPAEDPNLRATFERWKVDEKLREEILNNRDERTREKMTRLFEKEKFEDLSNADKKYLFEKLIPGTWATTLELEELRKERESYFYSEDRKEMLELAHKYLPDDVFYRINSKPIGEWTLNEAEELAKIIDDLTVKGKNIYKANIEAEQQRIRQYQKGIMETIGTVNKAGLSDDDKDKIRNKYNEGTAGFAQADAKRRKFNKFPKFFDMDIFRFARMLDNGRTDGKNMAILERRKNEARDNKLIAIDTHKEKILALMEKEGIPLNDLWKKEAEIDLGGYLGKLSATRAELIGFLSAIRNDRSRAAVLYGNLLSETEKREYQEGADTTQLKILALKRFAKVKQAAEKFIAENQNYKKLMEAINEDWAANGKRMSEALLNYNNQFMPVEQDYFRMIRTDPVSAQSADKKLLRDMKGSSEGSFYMYVDRSFTKARAYISILKQTGIKLDLFAVWDESVNQEEHFIAYGKLVKDLNAIYKDRQVANTIKNRYGKDAVDYINRYINGLANPESEKTRTDLEKILRWMRGNTAAAYLGWKASSIAKQAITSPAPFFAYIPNPLEYWGTLLEFNTHSKELWAEIEELSPYMKHRSANMLTDLVKELSKTNQGNKAMAMISQVNKLGMRGLEWIDRVCVAPGWLALYRKEVKRLTDSKEGATLSKKDIKVKAAQHADEIVRLTQPSGYTEDQAQLFRYNNEFGKAYLQFTQSLSNIWQNIRYDMPQMFRDKKGWQAARTVIGYTVASIMLGAIMIGFDDDDDEKMRAKKLAWWSTMQFTDAIPVFSGNVTNLMESWFTGKSYFQTGTNLTPALYKAFNSLQTLGKAVNKEDFDTTWKGIAQAAEAAELIFGFPMSALKEYGRLLGMVTGK